MHDPDQAIGRSAVTPAAAGAPDSEPRTRWLAALGRFEDLLGIALFAALIAVVLAQVVVRFLLYEWLQIAWADEIGRALLVWISFWGAVIVQRENGHIAVDLLYSRMAYGAQRLLRVVADVLVAAFLLLLAWLGLPIFLDSFQRAAPASGLPTVIFDGPLWLACLLMVLHIAANAAWRWRPAGERAVPYGAVPRGTA